LEADREQFVRELWDALAHLYEPDYAPGDLLRSRLGVSQRDDVRRALTRAIDGCAPDVTVPEGAAVVRLHTLLRWRYLDVLTQEQVAERLNLSVRHVRREQRKAIRMLAEFLLTKEIAGETAVAVTPSASEDWMSQVKEELAQLQANTGAGTSNLLQVLNGVLPLVRLQADQRSVQLQVGPVPDELTVALHPTALRQLLLNAAGRVLHEMHFSSLTLEVHCQPSQVALTLSPSQPMTICDLDDYLAGEILAATGGQALWVEDAPTSYLRITLPAVRQVTVLVVDDNSDLLHLYRRYVAHTSYHLVHCATGEEALRRLDRPGIDIIVLDVMLPDMDGWELLTRLRQVSDRRNTPVVVSTVVREQELARALGASEYLIKPVHREQFLDALERVCPPAQTRDA
jgi:CheY-like chemotaxis protein